MSVQLFIILLVGSNTACLFLGYLFGRLARATVRIEETMDPEQPTPPPAPTGRRVTALQVVAVLVVAVGLLTAVAGYQITRNQDRIVGCVVGYSNAAAAAAKERSAATNAVFDQIDMVFETIGSAFAAADVGQADAARKSVRAAFEAYNQARKDAKQAQKDNPLPDPPEHACAELLD